MSTGGLQEFSAGESPTAELMMALVTALRSLMAQQGMLTVSHRSGRTMRLFTPAGTAIARRDSGDKATATASEILWQMGPHVKVIPGGIVSGMEDAVSAAGNAHDVEIRAQITWEQVSAVDGEDLPEGWTLDASAAEFSASAMVEPEEGEEVEIERKIVINTMLAEAGPRMQKQRALEMWPTPQYPFTVHTSGTTRSFDGEYYLLPSPTCQQMLTDAYVPYYTSMTIGARPKQYYARLLGRLDRFGRLQCDSSLFYMGQRTT